MVSRQDKRLKLDILHGFGSLCYKGMRDTVSIKEESNGIKKIIYPMGYTNIFIIFMFLAQIIISISYIYFSNRKIFCFKKS